MAEPALNLENVNGSFCNAEESLILTRILNKKTSKTKKKIGKMITEFSAVLKHLKKSNIPIHERRHLAHLVRESTINGLMSLDIDKDVETFTRNVLSIIYKNKII